MDYWIHVHTILIWGWLNRSAFFLWFIYHKVVIHLALKTLVDMKTTIVIGILNLFNSLLFIFSIKNIQIFFVSR